MRSPDIEITSLSAIEHCLLHSDRIRWFECPAEASGRQQKLKALALKRELTVRTASEPRLRLLPFEYAPWDFLSTVKEHPRAFVLALDHLQDPQNFGALIRSAEALGARAAIVPKDRSVTVTNAVYSASAGSVETLPLVCVVNLGEALERLKKMEFWIVGAERATPGAKATPPWKIPDFEKVVLVLGAEYEGLSQRISGLCDWHVEIPLSGKIESLNVASAGAILMYELVMRGARGGGRTD